MGIQRDEPLKALATCPTPSRLRDFLYEQVVLTPEEKQHIGVCHRCQRLLDRLSVGMEATFIHEFLHHANDRFGREPELQALMQKISRTFGDDQLDTLLPDGETAPSNAALSVSEAEHTLGNLSGDIDPAPPPTNGLTADQLEPCLPDNRYQVQRLLTCGGAGAVYLAYDHRLHRDVAIKVLSRTGMRDRRRFQREASILASIEHPHIVRVYDFGELHSADTVLDGVNFLVMEYMTSGSLADTPARIRFADYRQMAKRLADAARGLAAAHRKGLVHRDIKPANLLTDTECSTIKIADFGLARHADPQHTQVTRTGDVVGTPEYMSPEQVECGESVAPAADLYGLGATLYALLSGEPPFRGTTAAVLRQVVDADPVAPRIINPDVPRDLETICLKAMEKSPSDRYATADLLADDLERFANGESISVRPVSAYGKLTRLLRRNRALGAAVLTCIALGLALVAGSIGTTAVFAYQRHQLQLEAKRSQASQRRAEDALSKSIDAADQLLVSVARDTELLPRTPGSQVISRQLLERAQSFFEAFLKEYRNHPHLTLELARAHVGIAQVSHRLEQASRVKDEVNQALQLIKRIPNAQDSQEQVVPIQAEALLILGNSQVDAGDVKQAVATLLNGVRICRNARLPQSADKQAHLLDLHALLLRALADAETTVGKHDDAHGHLLQSRMLFQQLNTQYPGDLSHVRDAALVDMSLATMAIDRGDVQRGHGLLESAADMLKKAAGTRDYSLRVRELLGIIHINLGLAERRLGNLQKSEAAYEQAIAEFRRLADLEPGVNNHKWKLVTATLNIGGPLLEQDRQQEVVTRWQQILPVLDQLIDAQPESLRYVQVKAMLQSNIAIVLKDMGRAADAVQPLISATRILREQSRRVDDAPEAYLPVALNYYELASTYLLLERLDDATNALDQSDDICHDLLDHHPTFQPARGQLLDNSLARFRVMRRQPVPDSKALMQLSSDAVELAKQLLKKQPELAEFQVDLPRALIMRGEAKLSQSEVGGAYADAQTALTKLSQYFEPPWSGTPKEAYHDAALLMAKVVARQMQDSKDQAVRQTKAAKLQQLLETAKEMGATREEVEAVASQP